MYIRRRGMAVYVGRDVSKLKNKGGKWKCDILQYPALYMPLTHA